MAYIFLLPHECHIPAHSKHTAVATLSIRAALEQNTFINQFDQMLFHLLDVIFSFKQKFCLGAVSNIGPFVKEKKESVR
jgi:hypothetical protein